MRPASGAALNFELGTLRVALEIPPSPAVAENQPGAVILAKFDSRRSQSKNRMNLSSIFESYAARLREFIRRHSPAVGSAPP